jgi:tetratricopeptide (TPR) repeat protein
MTDQIIQRASLLIQHRRYDEAINELRGVLASEPNNSEALALMGVSNTELGKHDDALKFVQQALGHDPDNPYFLYLVGLIYLRKDKPAEATKFILNAISFDPHNANYFGLLASIKLDQKEWQEALTYANSGLEVDAENLTCLNARSTALLKLNRKEESYSTIKEALQNDPHNSHTHANHGWGRLEQGDHKGALESFREALKLNPENEYAKAGLVEALKARYWFYRVFLKYVFWMTNMSSKYQWIFLLGMWFAVRALDGISRSNPSITPFVKPLVYLYSAFALSTWIVVPLSNLFLRLNVYGRFALTTDEIRASTFTGIGFVIALFGVIASLASGLDLYMYSIYGVGFMILCGSMFKPTEKRKRAIAMAVAIGLSTLGLLAILGGGTQLFLFFIYGTVIYQFMLNSLITR